MLKVNKHDKMISLDIENLYTNIHKDETLQIIVTKLQGLHINPSTVKQIENILHISLYQNYFTFNNKIYKQTKGLAMGDSVSGFIADIFLQHLEN